MKQLYLIFIFLVAFINSFAQQDTTQTISDTTQTSSDTLQTNDVGVNALPPGGGDDCITLMTTSLYFSSSGATKSVGVAATCSWSASDNRSWISITEDHSGGKIYVTCTDNPNFSSRSGTVTVSSSTEDHYISVSQSAKSCTPTTYTLDGTSTSWCQGSGSSVTLTLSGSESGVDYTLMDGSTSLATQSGTGSSLSWNVSPNTVGDHIYSVVAERISPSCENTMNGNVTITVNENPNTYTLSKNGDICNGYDILLSNSQGGVTYDLRREGNVVDTRFVKITEGGSSINFGHYTTAGTYDVMAVDDANGCTSTTNNISITSPSTPSITDPSNKTICENGSVTFSVSGTNVDNYQWQEKSPGGIFSNITGEQSTSLSISNVSTSKNGYQYRCIGQGTCESAVSEPATLTVNSNTQITEQPSDQTVCEGNSVYFDISAGGTNVTYQWQSNKSGSWTNLTDGSRIEGSNTNQLTIYNTMTEDVADYRVIVSGDCGQDKASNLVSLTVNKNTVIDSQPSGKTVCEGSSASFSVSADGTSVSYQWQEYNGSSWTNISGATNTSYTVSSASLSKDGYLYRCQVSGTCGTVNSSSATLSVNKNTVIDSQPSDKTVCEGSSASFSVSADGTSVSYQWQEYNGSSWTNISGATNTSYTVSSASLSKDGYQYRCRVSGTCGTLNSNSVNLTVNPLTQITSQPTDKTLCEGSDAVFSVDADGTNRTYRWQSNASGTWQDLSDGGAISGAGNNTLTLSNTALSDNGNYRCRVDGDCGTTKTSSEVTLTVNPLTQITSQPTDKTLCEGSDAIFSVDADGTNLTYQWQSNASGTWQNLSDGGYISGSATKTLTLSNSGLSDNGKYRCQVSGGCGTDKTSNEVTLTVNPNTIITTQPNGKTLCEGTNAVFSVGADGTGTLSYQWQSNSSGSFQNLTDGGDISGATGSTLSISNSSNADEAFYRVVVSSACGSDQPSNEVELTVNDNTAITTQPTTQTVCEGSSAIFTAYASGTGSINYQWQSNTSGSFQNLTDGGDITGATSPTLTIANASNTDEASYRLLASSACGVDQFSNEVALNVNEATDITGQASDQSLCPGEAATFTIAAHGTNEQYQWQTNKDGSWANIMNGGNITGANGSQLSILNVDQDDNAHYRCLVSGECGVDQVSDSVRLTVHIPTQIVSQPSDIAVIEGNTASFSVSAAGTNLQYQWQTDSSGSWQNLVDDDHVSHIDSEQMFILNPDNSDEAHYRCLISGVCGEDQVSDSVYLTVDCPYLPGQIDGSSRTIEPSSKVGSIPASFNVSPTGATTYNIPIEVPKGINGMQPQLSVRYNSQSGNGVLGRGWQVTGISSITRGPATRFTDGFADGADFDSTDKFYLGGKRLIAIDGTYGGDGTEYRTELDNYSKIISQASQGELTFKVWTASGLVMEFGLSTNSRKISDAGFSDQTMIWYISRVYDYYGNEINYTYLHENNQIVIDKIHYGENFVQFFYDSNYSDANYIYQYNTTFNNDLLLYKVLAKSKGETYRSYEFSYYDQTPPNDPNRSLRKKLNRITLQGANGEEYNPTIFNYGAHKDTIVHRDAFYLSNAMPNSLRFGDFNGDGKTDMLSYFYDSGTDRITAELALSNGQGFDFNSSIALERFIYDDGCQAFETGLGELLIGNFDDDVDQEILFVISVDERLDDPYCDMVQLEDTWLFLYDYDRSSNQLVLKDSEQVLLDGIYVERPLIGDYDANGIDEILIRDHFDGDQWELVSFHGTPDIPDEVLNTLVDWNGKHYPIEWDGDQAKEIMTVYTDSCVITNIMKDGVERTRLDYPLKEHKLRLADFNGDGLTDVLTYIEGDNWWKIGFSNSQDFNEEINAPIFWGESGNGKMIPGDFNGDGRFDILEQEPTQTGNVATKIHYNFEEDFYTQQITLAEEVVFEYPEHIHYPMVLFIDFNGDGKSDFLQYDEDTRYFDMFIMHPFEKSHLITEITNGMNISTKIDYEPLTTSDHYHKGTLGGSYPHFNYPASLYVATGYQKEHDNTRYDSIRIDYTGGKYHIQRGFLGFEKIVSYNGVTDMKKLTQYESLQPLYINGVKSTSTYYNDNLVSSSVVTNELADTMGVENPYYRKYQEQVVKTNSLTGVDKTTNFEDFDENKNPRTIITRYGSAPDMTVTKQRVYSMVDTDSLWIPARMDSVTVIKDHRDGGIQSTTTTYGYSGQFKLTSKTQFAGDSMEVSTHYTYDSYGNLTRDSVTAGGKSRTTVYNYSEDHRFIEKEEQQPGMGGYYTLYNYDELTGNLTAETDLHGKTTTHRYDGFGNRIKTSYPDGEETTTTTRWITGQSGYQVIQSSNLGGDVTKTYDIVGRLMEEETTNPGGTVRRAYEYYDNGKIWKEYEPYFASQGKGRYTEYVYSSDDGRLKQKHLPNDTTLTYDYNGLTTEVISPRGTKTTTKDAYGLTDKVVDEGGTIDYTYYGSGQLQQVRYGAATYTMEYDVQGNRTRLVDPDAGAITTRYNAFGELLSRTDARGHTYTYGYDSLGRMSQRSLASGGETTTWTYGTGDNKGLLMSVDGPDVDITYSYDDKRRLSSMTETIGGSDYTISYGYDSYDRPVETVYPGGKRVTRAYDADGFLESVKLEGSPVWTAGDMNAAGRWTRYTYGNGITTEKTYNPYHLLDSIHAGAALDYGLTFDKNRGNLLRRANHATGQGETFGYDRLNRLIKDTTGVVEYEQNGNIATKAGVGTYTYNTSRPHAASGITRVDPNYSPPAHEISFTAFNKIKDIEADNEALGHTYRQAFTYGPQRSRKLVKTYRDGAHIRSRVYAGGIYEAVTDHQSDTTTGYHYISGGDGLAAILVSRPDGDSLYYVHKDHLGSILALTNPAGTVVERYSFDAWGRRRNPTDWSQKASGLGYITNRGFTGHEHMDLFGLINMNGRIYDPALGRFLSPDPYVQMPDNSQNFNRYSYALNNPLVYTDPSGEWLWIPMVIGAYFGGKAANDGEWNPFKWDLDGETLLGVGIGGALGYFTGYAGAQSGLNLAATMGAAGFGMTSGMVSGAVYSGISSDWNAAAMFMGAWSGGMAGGVSGLAMSGLGAAWDGISFGHTGTIGDAVRKGLGGLPGLTYRKWSMSQVIWTGFNLPSAGTMLANTSMLVNGALHGQWGSKLVPVGEYRFDYQRFTYGPSNQSQKIKENFNLRHMRLRTGGELWSQIDQAKYYGNAFNNQNDVFRLATGNQKYMVRGNNRNENMNILANRFSMNLALTPGSVGQLYIHGQTFQRYMEDINPPWWVRFFFGLQNQSQLP